MAFAPACASPVTAYICRLEAYKRKAGSQGGSGRIRTTATATSGDTGKPGRRETGTGSLTYSARAVHRPGGPNS